ncbi:MAG: helix-turn-helix domain-containing protein [Sneathiella sp.]
MDIGDVVKHSGLPASTLRFYEDKGLIYSAGRRGLRRIFEINILDRLSLITLGRRVGFSLEEIGSMLTPDSSNIDRSLLTQKADELDRNIKELTAMRDGLRHAAKCSAPSHLECPTFRRLLNIARRKRTK